MIQLPDSYYIAVALCTSLLVFAVINARQPWAVPFGTVVATVSAWYLIEPFYFPELFAQFSFESVETAYDSVSIFFVALFIVAPVMAAKMQPQRVALSNLSMSYVSAERIVYVVACVWLALLVYGIYRMEGDLTGALFPIESRAGARMWGRAAGAGAGVTGFIVSAASYIYVLCLAAFGLLFFLVKKKSSYILLGFLILISWPYAFLQGSRNVALATVGPAGIAFLLFSKVTRYYKIVALVVGLVVLDIIMRVMITFRNEGFANIDISAAEKTQHLGLNMASELVYITTFLKDGTLSLSYGAGYLAEFANLIPRAIWPDKPMIGIEYALARGYGDFGQSDIGVFATISSGMIGQGVLNFGSLFGPIAAAILMSLWIGLLTRLWIQATPLRLGLFLVGLGLTFNLGRDITLLVLWPFVFGYIGVRLFEYVEKRRRQRFTLPSRGFK